jgi:hypothetical protein
MNDQLGLLFRRERLEQDDRCRRLWGPLKEFSDFSSSRKIFHVVIITTYKTWIFWFTLILLINKLCFCFLDWGLFLSSLFLPFHFLDLFLLVGVD